MADKKTTIDIAPAETVSADVAKKFKLDPHLLGLLWNEPFYSGILRRVTKIRTNNIPTAGVSAEKGELKLWWNPQFVAGLESKNIRGLLKHECWHIILGHIFDRRKEPHIHWNYATDWAINSMIPEDELPECGLFPGRPFNPLTDEQLEKMTPQRIKDHQTLSAFQARLPKDMSSEWYFAELNKDSQVSEALQRQGEEGAEGIQMDSHEGWDDMSDEDREFVRGKVKKVLEKAAKEADEKSNGWGNMSASARKKIRSIISKEIPWQSVLKKFCGTARRADRRSNHKRLNRKYPGLLPGMQKGYTTSIAVYIDQSGSVSDASLELLFGELQSLVRHTEFTCFFFDTRVDEASEQLWRKGRAVPTGRTRSGGTDFSAPTVHANKNKHRFDGYLILTDGEAPDPGPSKLKRGWVVIPDRKLYFNASNRDFVIQMKDKVKK